MLRKLTLENFYSIAEAQTLDLGIARNVPDPENRYLTPISTRKERFPRIVALFGANASGKTNVLRSLKFLFDFVQNSADHDPSALLSFLSFNLDEWIHRPTKFSVEFYARVSEQHEERVLYIYELEIAPGRTEVQKESLKYYPKGHRRNLFSREGDQIKSGKDFDFPKRDPVRKKIRKNASLISMLAKFNHPFSIAIHSALSGVSNNVQMVGDHYEMPENSATQYYQYDQSIFDLLNKEIRRFDLGISKVGLENTPQGIRPTFYHDGINSPMSLDLESRGTRRFYTLFPFLYHALSRGTVAVLDEFDNDIHSLLLPELLNTFLSPEKNKNDAQLIIGCHSSAVFQALEKDEIYFTEKDKNGKTSIYGLHDIQDVRRDTDLLPKYQAGAFGGVPRIG